MKKEARIIGTGSYLPDKILSNADLEKIVDTSDEWIVTRTGMRERRIAADNEFTSDMGAKSAKMALKDAGMRPEDIDLILVATLSPDYIFPSTAALIQHELGAAAAAACDIQAACSGYLYGLSIAKAYIESGSYKNILLIASEKLSSIVDYEDRATCVLFGDGAASSVISDEGPGYFIRGVSIGCDGGQAELLMQPAGGTRRPASQETVKNREHFIVMNGREIFKHAVRRMEGAAKECLEKVGLSDSALDWLVPHQANERIIDAIAKRFGIADEKVYKTVEKYGNTSASAVAIAFDELVHERKIERGDNFLLVAFGAGLAWGASILTKGG